MSLLSHAKYSATFYQLKNYCYAIMAVPTFLLCPPQPISSTVLNFSISLLKCEYLVKG